jgi:hypothetical protein
MPCEIDGDDRSVRPLLLRGFGHPPVHLGLACPRQPVADGILHEGVRERQVARRRLYDEPGHEPVVGRVDDPDPIKTGCGPCEAHLELPPNDRSDRYKL